jgi:chain length determinant protein EpsF
MSFSQVLLILRARIRIVTGVFALVVLAALALALLLPKKYTATASVVIDTKSDPIAATINVDQMSPSYVSTEEEVIGSVRVVARAIKAIKLDQQPEIRRAWLEDTQGQGDTAEWLAEFVTARRLVVSAAGQNKAVTGNVIDIAVTWPDSRVAPALANAIAAAAIETNIELKIEPAKQYAVWFNERSHALRADLEAKQKRLSDFQNKTGLVATDEKLDVENARLNELSTQLVVMQGLRQDSQSRQRVSAEDNATLPEVLQSPVIGKLKDDLSAAEAKQAEIAGRLGKNHPDYQAAAAEVQNLRERISQEAAKIVASLNSSTQINVRREASLRQALEEQKQRVLELKHEHDEASVLDNDVTTAQRDLDAVTQRFAQSSLESQSQQTNMVLLTPAAQPFRPSSPKVPLFVAAGIFIGAALGIALALIVELRNPKIRAESELEQMLGVPVLVRIRYLNWRKLGRSLPPPAPPQLRHSSI